MKHIKRAKASLISLMLGESRSNIIPTVAIYFTPPVGMSTASQDAESEVVSAPMYQIVDIFPVDYDLDTTLVDVVIRELLLPDSDESKANVYKLSIPLQYLTVAHALSLANKEFCLIGLPKSDFLDANEVTVKVDDLSCVIQFPDSDSEEYNELMGSFSKLLADVYMEPLSSYAIENRGKGVDSIPYPMRKAQMAILPFIAGLAVDDILSLRNIVALEPFFDEFHERNHNPDVDQDSESEEYNGIVSAFNRVVITDSSMVKPEDEDDPYSIISKMTDDIQDYVIKNDSVIYEREYYSDLTALVFLSNIRNTYIRSNSDKFLTTSPIVSEDRENEKTPGLHTAFMSLAEDSLSGLFKDLDENLVKRTPIEQLWATDVNRWHQSPIDYWPKGMDSIEEEIKKLPHADEYYDVMTTGVTTDKQWHELVAKYGLGIVITSVVIKTALNLVKFKEIADVNRQYPISLPLLATMWLNSDEDEYIWEIPAFAYNVANHDVEGFTQLLHYEKEGNPLYVSIIFGTLMMVLQSEAWNKEEISVLLTSSGMPLQYQPMLVDLVDKIDNFEVDFEELKEYEFETTEDGIKLFISMHIGQELFNDEEFDLDMLCNMIAYAIPALADIHVASHAVDDVIDEMGTLSWKRHRIEYVQSILNMVVQNIDRKDL